MNVYYLNEDEMVLRKCWAQDIAIFHPNLPNTEPDMLQYCTATCEVILSKNNLFYWYWKGEKEQFDAVMKTMGLTEH